METNEPNQKDRHGETIRNQHASRERRKREREEERGREGKRDVNYHSISSILNEEVRKMFLYV